MSDIFSYFEDVPANVTVQEWWGEYHDSIKKALTEISQIQGLPDDFSVDYIKQKEGVGIRIEYENARDKNMQVREILTRLENETVYISSILETNDSIIEGLNTPISECIPESEVPNKYLLSDIVIEGIEPTEEYKILMEKEKRGEITAEEIAKIIRRPHVVKE